MAARLRLGAQGAAVLAVAALLALLVWKLTHQPHVARGKAPNFQLQRIDAEGKLSLAGFRGKAVVLNFWASWCVPCKEEAPRLEAASRKWGRRGVVVIGIDSQDFTGDARRFARRYGLSYPLVHDGPGEIRDLYGVSGFPETFFVDRGGRIVGDHIQGPVSEKVLDENIRQALET